MTKALCIQVTDPYFTPNGDGVKDSLNLKVIAETSEPYLVAIKRNGIAVKSWAGLTGEQTLNWDGMANRQALADGTRLHRQPSQQPGFSPQQQQSQRQPTP